MNEHQIVDSSFTAIINVPIDKIDIPARRQANVHQRRDYRRQPDGAALR
jgi:hypothetical protein